jgi:ferredoxin
MLFQGYGFVFQLKQSLFSTTKHSAVKYPPEELVDVSVNKPLGLVFEEIEENASKGVYVVECNDGNAKSTGKVFPGMMLVQACGQDTHSLNFDAIMDILRESPENKPLNLRFIDVNAVFRGKANLAVTLPDGKEASIECLKGQILRDVLMQAELDVYDIKGKMTNCGGGGVCGTCIVQVNSPGNDWDPRPSFEEKRCKKFGPNARLSCNTLIEGDAKVVLQPKKI